MKNRLGFVDKEFHGVTLEYNKMALHNIAVIFTGLNYNGIAEMKQYLLLVIDYDYSIELLLNFIYK